MIDKNKCGENIPTNKCDNCKELKALEIIKNKWVNIEALIQSKTLDDYNTTLCVHDLTQEEYDLLKEVLL